MRMKIRMGSPLRPYELFPIYELDGNALAANQGFEESITPSTIAQGYHIHKFSVTDAQGTFFQAIDANVPRVPEAQGNIIPYRNGYSEELGGYQYLENWFDSTCWERITDDDAPSDWGTSDQYYRIWTGTGASIYNYVWPYLKGNVNTYDKTNCYKSLKNQLSRIFYTEKGAHFGCYKGGGYGGPGLIVPEQWNVGSYPFQSAATTEAARKNYLFSDENGNTLNTNFHLGDSISVNDSDTLKKNSKNIVMVFVHYTYDVTPAGGTTTNYEFYGIALIYFPNFAEDVVPTTISVIGIDPTYWEGNVIEGGGGKGQWTNDGVNSHVQGGQGTFQAPSDNHGDSGGVTAKQTASTWSDNHAPFDTGYNKYLLSSPDANAFRQMVDNLVNPDVWQGFSNKYYNPIDCVITCALIPAYLAPSGSQVGSNSVIKASALNLTNITVPTFNIWNKSVHIGTVDVAAYCDGFPDFDNTAIYINLPYVGVKQLDINACMEGTLSVDYLIDYITQDVTAQIWVKDKFGNYNIRYEFKGNCGQNIPLTQIVPKSTQIMQSVGSGLIGTATSLAGSGIVGLAAGNAAKAAAMPNIMSNTSKIAKSLGVSMSHPEIQNIISGAGRQAAQQGFWGSFAPAAGLAGTGAISTMANGALQAGQEMMYSNASGGAVSSPINTQCYVCITRPQWSAPEDYGKRFGYPSDIGGTINQSDTEGGDPFTNFLSVRAILLDRINCLPDERAEIESLMSAGVYVSND